MCSTDAGRAAHRPQSPLRRRRVPRQLRQRLPRLPGQDRQERRHHRRDAATSRVPHLHDGQMARHTAERDRSDRPDRRLASGRAASIGSTDSSTPRPTSTPPNSCATTPTSTAPGTYETGYHLTERPGRRVDPDAGRTSSRRPRPPVVHVPRAGRLPRAAPGRPRTSSTGTTRCSPTAGTQPATGGSPA